MLPTLLEAVVVEVLDAVMDGVLEHVEIGEGRLGEVVASEMAPIALDVVQFWA